MKDIVISARRIRRELLIFAVCILAAFAVNAGSILWFKTEWKELFTTLHITLAVAVIIFVLLALVRLLVAGFIRIFRRKLVTAASIR